MGRPNKMEESAEFNRRDKTPTQINGLETVYEQDRIGGQHPRSHSKVMADLNKKKGKSEGQPKIALFNEKDQVAPCWASIRSAGGR